MAQFGFSPVGAANAAGDMLAESAEMAALDDAPTIKVVAGDEDAYYALFVEIGARGGPPPMKYMERAVNEALAEFESYVSTAVTEGTPRMAKIDAGELVGGEPSGADIANRTANIFVDQVKKKAEEKVPVDSGDLRNSIHIVRID